MLRTQFVFPEHEQATESTSCCINRLSHEHHISDAVVVDFDLSNSVLNNSSRW